MVRDQAVVRYLDALLRGERKNSRSVIEETLQSGTPTNLVYMEVIWPAMVEIERLLRADKLTQAQEHLATRINRSIVDQLQNKLPRRPARNKKIVICCAPDELQELGGQIIADLFESDGWEVRFLGGGLTNDDILAFVHDFIPEILLIYGTTPRQAPSVRRLIDRIKEVNAHPTMKIMVSGGLFNRAEELWQEIGADAFAETAELALEIAAGTVPIEQISRTINRRKKKRTVTAAEQQEGQKSIAC
ncbi:MAG: cobalamin-dependent protein [Sedimentisphaerales bacterium]|nr:cobalamin-dependent protein [Sedimentisphaerales bacterium]